MTTESAAKRPRTDNGPRVVSDEEFSSMNFVNMHITVEIQPRITPETYAAILQSTTLGKFITRVLKVFFTILNPEQQQQLRRSRRVSEVYTLAIRKFSEHQLLTPEEIQQIRLRMTQLVHLHVQSVANGTTPSTVVHL